MDQQLDADEQVGTIKHRAGEEMSAMRHSPCFRPHHHQAPLIHSTNYRAAPPGCHRNIGVKKGRAHSQSSTTSYLASRSSRLLGDRIVCSQCLLIVFRSHIGIPEGGKTVSMLAVMVSG